jgi:hypothetical protein
LTRVLYFGSHEKPMAYSWWIIAYIAGAIIVMVLQR